MRNLCGYYDLSEKQYRDTSEGVFVYETETLLLRVFGNVRTGEAFNDGAALSSLYTQFGLQITEYLSGAYLLLIFEKETGILRVFQDRATSPVTLYYSEIGDRLYLSASLKSLLAASCMTCRLNEQAVEEFLVNGFLYDDATLMENVFKIKAYHCLSVENGLVGQFPVRYPQAEMTKGEALDRFKPTLDRAIERCIADLDDVSFPLSSGYDSNYIAFVATKCKESATAFSVGGSRGKNEVPIVEKNAPFYPNLTLHTAVTDGATLSHFPDIVWRLEGNVFESGLFLQYELMNLVKKAGKPTLVCGECADQIMNLHYHRKDRIYPQHPDGAPLYYEFSEYPYIFSSYLILKKNGILANSFGVETRYPYLDEDLISVCAPLGEISRKDKRVHVANCHACLPPEVIANMSKIGGSTDCHSLFASADEMQSFFRKVERTAFFKAHKELILKHSSEEKERQTGLTALKTKVRNTALSALHARSNDSYYSEELKLREYLCVVYLAIFERLFVSDPSDFSAESCAQPFETFFE
ncbi:MAG: hypothetical protein IK080_05635 [Clostridia bacterium]|nr:hypothetical protein [Clostridia bacterium]